MLVLETYVLRLDMVGNLEQALKNLSNRNKGEASRLRKSTGPDIPRLRSRRDKLFRYA